MSWAIMINDPSKTNEYLERSLGITLRDIQDNNRLSAVTEPDVFMETRRKAIKKLTADNGAVGAHYKKRYDEYIKLGLSYDMAIELATESAREIYRQELKILDLASPGAYEAAFDIGQLNTNTQIAKSKLIAPELGSKSKSYKLLKNEK